MDDQWYILVADRKKAGPVPFEKLQELKNKGKIAPNTMIRRVNDPKWVAAALVSGLFGTLLSESNASMPILNGLHDLENPGYDYTSKMNDIEEDSSETAFIQTPDSLQGEEFPENDQGQEHEEFPLLNIKVVPRSSRGGKSKKPAQAVTLTAVAPNNGSIELAADEVPALENNAPISNQGQRARAKGGGKYPALLTISFLLKILAVLYVVFGVLAALGMFLGGLIGGSSSEAGIGGGLFMGGGILMGLIGGMICICGSLFPALLLWAIAELIRLLMDIEENTRA